MIRTNLSTRPFYNERTVHLFLLAAAIVVVAVSVANLSSVIKYSRTDTRLGAEASQNESRAAELRKAAAALRATVDAKQIDLASAEARQANELIDRRVFSWTELTADQASGGNWARCSLPRRLGSITRWWAIPRDRSHMMPCRSRTSVSSSARQRTRPAVHGCPRSRSHDRVSRCRWTTDIPEVPAIAMSVRSTTSASRAVSRPKDWNSCRRAA